MKFPIPTWIIFTLISETKNLFMHPNAYFPKVGNQLHKLTHIFFHKLILIFLKNRSSNQG